MSDSRSLKGFVSAVQLTRSAGKGILLNIKTVKAMGQTFGINEDVLTITDREPHLEKGFGRMGEKTMEKMKIKMLFGALAFLAALLIGCGGGGGSGGNPISPAPVIPAAGEEVKSSLARITNPAVNPADVTEIASGQQAFSLNLFQAIRAAPGNLFVSPFSIWQALGMTQAGASGTTAAEITSTLQFTLPFDRIHPSCNFLDLALASRGSGTSGFKLKIVNALWGQKGVSFLAQFLDILAQNYGAGLRLLDFATDPDTARQTINAWVSAMTEQRIPELLSSGLNETLRVTRLVLTNAVYFKADWANKFQTSATTDTQFTLSDGSTKSVRMMRQTEAFPYAEGAGWKAVEMPYVGKELGMVVILPTAGTLAAFEAGFDKTKWSEITGALATSQVRLGIPKFTFTFSTSLASALKSMGMRLAFTDQADFSGMTTQFALQILEVIHQAYVNVDETGTEAAAATAVLVGLTAAPVEDKVFECDHPFIFAIRDRPTGSILFLGRVSNP